MKHMDAIAVFHKIKNPIRPLAIPNPNFPYTEADNRHWPAIYGVFAGLQQIQLTTDTDSNRPGKLADCIQCVSVPTDFFEFEFFQDKLYRFRYIYQLESVFLVRYTRFLPGCLMII